MSKKIKGNGNKSWKVKLCTKVDNTGGDWYYAEVSRELRHSVKVVIANNFA